MSMKDECLLVSDNRMYCKNKVSYTMIKRKDGTKFRRYNIFCDQHMKVYKEMKGESIFSSFAFFKKINTHYTN